MKNRYCIPPVNTALISRIRGRFVKLIALSALITVLAACIGAVYLTNDTATRYASAVIGLMALLAAIPWCFTIFVLIRDRGFEGVITSVEVKTVADSKSNVKITREMLYKKNIVELIVESDGGRTASVSMSFPCLSQLDYYKPGDRVIRYSGTRYFIKCRALPQEQEPCVLCGSFNRAGDDRCHGCFLPVIKH